MIYALLSKIYTRFHGQNLPGLGGRVGEPNFGNASILGSFGDPPLNGFTLFDRFASLFGLNYFLISKIYTI